jgi:DNA-binding NarL/FixJ family response regulator
VSDPPKAIRVLLVDDHPMVREGLRSMLGHDDGVAVVGEAGSAGEALRICTELLPDVVLLDMELPDSDGIRTIEKLRRIRPEAAVLVVTMHDDPALVHAAVAAGAAGYVLKGVGRQELLASVRAVQSGKVVLDHGLMQAALPMGVPGIASTALAAEALTAVEHAIVKHIAAGLSNREIADHMHWSVATVKKYVQRVLAKLGVSDRTQAAVVAVRRGLLE